jgi:hypothetical protein
MAPGKLLPQLELYEWLSIMCCELVQLFHVEQFELPGVNLENRCKLKNNRVPKMRAIGGGRVADPPLRSGSVRG